MEGIKKILKLENINNYLYGRTRKRIDKRGDYGLIDIIQGYEINKLMKKDDSLTIRVLSNLLGFFPTSRRVKIAYELIGERQNKGNFIIPKWYCDISKEKICLNYSKVLKNSKEE